MAGEPAKQNSPENAKQTMAHCLAENDGASVDATLAGNVTSGRPMRMSVRIRNDGDAPIYCNSMGDLPNLFMEMNLEDRDTKAAIELTDYGKAVFRQAKTGGSIGLAKLQKGKERSWTIDLNRFFAMRRGSFKLSATFLLERASPTAQQDPFIKVVVHDLDFNVTD